MALPTKMLFATDGVPFTKSLCLNSVLSSLFCMRTPSTVQPAAVQSPIFASVAVVYGNASSGES